MMASLVRVHAVRVRVRVRVRVHVHVQVRVQAHGWLASLCQHLEGGTIVTVKVSAHIHTV